MIDTSKIESRVTFKGMDSSDAVKEYASKRALKLAKHLHNMTHVDFVFATEKNDHIAQAHVVSGDFEAKAEARSENMYAAIDDLADKLVQQTRKHKERLSDHHAKPHHDQMNEVLLAGEAAEEE